MKTISADLKAHMALGSTTLAHLMRLERVDGVVLTVTLDHDDAIEFDDEIYLPALGMMPSTIETSGSLNVDNLDARGALLILGIEEADIDAGLWDMCEVRVLRVNWSDLTMGAEKIKRGNIGKVSIGRDDFNAEVRGITQRLQHTVGDIVSPACQADLFDARCGVTATEGVWKFSGVEVSGVTSAHHFAASELERQTYEDALTGLANRRLLDDRVEHGPFEGNQGPHHRRCLRAARANAVRDLRRRRSDVLRRLPEARHRRLRREVQ